MEHAPRVKRKPQALHKAANPAPDQKPLARAADKTVPGYMQAKMKVSQPGDAHEQQADQVAERVARAAKPPAFAERDSLQRATLRPGQDVGDPQQSLSLKPAAGDKTPDPALRRKPAATPIASADEALDQKPAGDQPQAAEVSEQIDPSTEQRINDLRGQGQPLAENAANDMRQELQADLSAVRIHTGAEAADLAAAVNARAFTVGNDIFFADGEYAPDSAEGRKLLAHELTHVAQQGGGMGRLMREPAKAKPKSTAAMQGKGKAKLDGDTLLIEGLALPDKPGLKDTFGDTVTIEKGKRISPRPDNQRQVWMSEVKAPDANKVTAKAARKPEQPGVESSVYALKAKGTEGGYLIGGIQDMVPQLKIPWWDENGALNNFDVDHIREIQLGGTNSSANMRLLDASVNRSAGSRIDKALEARVRNALPIEAPENGETPAILGKELPKPSSAANTGTANAAAGAAGDGSGAGKAPSPVKTAIDEIFNAYNVKFTGVSYNVPMKGNPAIKWDKQDIEDGSTLKGLEAPKGKELDKIFDDKTLKIFPRPGGGVMFVSPLNPDGTFSNTGSWGKRLEVVGGHFDRDQNSGEINVNVNTRGGKKAVPGALKLQGNPSAPLLASVVPASILPNFKFGFNHSLLSPITLDSAEMDAGGDLAGGGRLKVDGIPLLADARIDLRIVGGEIILSRTFSTEEISVKGPIQIDESSLSLSIGTGSGIEIGGAIDFHIGELATGSLTGTGRADGFNLGADLQFEKDLFSGSGSMNYDTAKGFKAAGNLNLKPGALKGVKKAGFKLAYDDQKKAIDFSGDAELSVPGFKGASLSAQADEAGNISLGGEAVLSDSIPRIKAGKLNVNAARKGEAWTLGGGGELEPDLSGLDASAKIKLDYQDGVLTGKVKANYKRGMLAGNVDLNAKALLGEGGGEAEPLTVWGSGTVDVKAAPWLKATVGLTLDEQGEITVSGELGLPSSLEVFPRKEIDKRLFGVATQIPIIPGVVAEVGGNLGAKAGIGPGALTQLKIGLTYNPDHEEDTKITGSAALKVPADAGLRLAARAGIGLGITGASATGGLEIGGTLGVTGAAEAAVDIDWTPTKGLALKADLAVHAQPSFTFDVSGYVAVTALGASLYEQRWELASYQFGSDYRFGISLPVRYTEGQAFDISLDDVKFEVPDISPSDIVHGLLSKIV
ncbi:DUF4157 domain-containing protein [Methylomonas sp. SURF-2]|uniref:DUF4157 domain-containing protein n=1 Tax=Methylomonas subterranea TaxID=2952225 RepID=A0ABT1TE21_9GAMM|nr:DUF4157 domain-containing protein [Methylomonas sp. SURF-2]MCQ8103705.1 DUF4157 domain-containing protein [Methylomonas sp. SURF-2]